MNVKTMLGALAACALMAFGCNNNGFRNGRQGTTSSVHGPAGNSFVAQSGELSGKVTDVSNDSFNVQVAEGRTVELKKSGPASVGIEKDQQIRATYRVDTDGNKIAQNVTQLGKAPAGEEGTGGSGISGGEHGKLEGTVTQIGDKDFTVQVENGKAVKLLKGSSPALVHEGSLVRARFHVDKDGNNLTDNLTVLRSGAQRSGAGNGNVPNEPDTGTRDNANPGQGTASQPGQE